MTTARAPQPATPTGSVVIRKSLGRQLRALRLGAGKTPGDVAEAQICGTSKLHRVETGAVAIKVVDVWAFCRLYKVDAVTTDRLAELAKNTSRQGWWEGYTDLMPPRFGLYIELEAAASRLSHYDGELIHGLLQTPAYHRAVFEFDPYPAAKDADRQIQLRIARQQAAFRRIPPVRLTTILGEGAVTREVGGKRIMDEQRRHLLELNDQPHIEVYVLPWGAGAHGAMNGGFTIVGFDGPDDPDVVYFESYLGARYVEEADALRRYQHGYTQLRAISVPLKEYWT